MIREAGVGYIYKQYSRDKDIQSMDDAQLGRYLMQTDPQLVNEMVQKAKSDYDQSVGTGTGIAASLAKGTQSAKRGFESFTKGLEESGGTLLPATIQGGKDIGQSITTILGLDRGDTPGVREARQIMAEDIYSPIELEKRFGSPLKTTKTLGRSVLGAGLSAVTGAGDLALAPLTLAAPTVGAPLQAGWNYATGYGMGLLAPEGTPESAQKQAEKAAVLGPLFALGGATVSRAATNLAGMPRFQEFQEQAGQKVGNLLKMLPESWQQRISKYAPAEAQVAEAIPLRASDAELRQRLASSRDALTSQRMQLYPQTVPYSTPVKEGAPTVEDLLNPNSKAYPAIGELKSQISKILKDFKKQIHPELADEANPSGQTIDQYVKGNPNKEVPVSFLEKLRKASQDIRYGKSADRPAGEAISENVYKTMQQHSVNPAETKRLHELTGQAQEAINRSYEKKGNILTAAVEGVLKKQPIKAIQSVLEKEAAKVASLTAPQTQWNVLETLVPQGARKPVLDVTEKILGPKVAKDVASTTVTNAQVQQALARLIGGQAAREQRAPQQQDQMLGY